MEKEKAIEIFNKWMDCKDAYQADPSCDGNCYSCEYNVSAEEEREAMLLAISALEKQEQDRWIPVTERLPELNEEVLVTNGDGIVYHAEYQSNFIDEFWDELAFVAVVNSATIYGVKAWRPLPEPYTEEEV